MAFSDYIVYIDESGDYSLTITDLIYLVSVRARIKSRMMREIRLLSLCSMKASGFNEWLGSLPTLSAAQKQRLEDALAGTGPATTITRELDALGVSRGPHCAAGLHARFGHASGLQRYKCHACRRMFNALTGQHSTMTGS